MPKNTQRQVPVSNNVISLDVNGKTLFAITRESGYWVNGDGITGRRRNYSKEHQNYMDLCAYGFLKNLGIYFCCGTAAGKTDIPFIMFIGRSSCAQKAGRPSQRDGMIFSF